MWTTWRLAPIREKRERSARRKPVFCDPISCDDTSAQLYQLDQVTESRPLSKGGDNTEEECWEAILWDGIQAPYCGVTEDVSKSIQDSNHLGQKQQVRNISHYVFKMKWEEL